MRRLRRNPLLHRSLPGPIAAGLAIALLTVTAAASEAAGSPRPERSASDAQGWRIETIELERSDSPGVRHLVAEGTIEAPARAIWSVIDGPGEGGTKWPGVKETVIEHVAAETTIARYRLDIPVYRDRRYRLRTVSDSEAMLLRFEMIPGYGNVREIRGSWEVTPLTVLRSRVTYTLDTDPGVSLVPKFIVNWATRRAVPRLFAFLHERSSHLAQGPQGSDARHP